MTYSNNLSFANGATNVFGRLCDLFAIAGAGAGGGGGGGSGSASRQMLVNLWVVCIDGDERTEGVKESDEIFRGRFGIYVCQLEYHIMLHVQWRLCVVIAILTLAARRRSFHIIAFTLLHLVRLEYVIDFKVHPSVVRDLGVQLYEIAIVLQLVGCSPKVWQGGDVFEDHSHRDNFI